MWNPQVEDLAERLLCDFWRSSAGKLLRADLSNVHGFGIWAVIGGVGLETAYHVDYAEMYRRRTNCIVPPLHAATLQVSPVAPDEIEGGTFAAHSDGLEHYQRHGYKCRRQPPTEGLPTSDWGTSAGWTYAPYTFRQATLSNGELPHACDKVKRWPEGRRRVVIGINTFGRLEGPVELEVPQHSAEFRQSLKLELMLAKAGSKEQFVKMLLEQRKQKRAAAAKAAATPDSSGMDMEVAPTCEEGGQGKTEASGARCRGGGQSEWTEVAGPAATAGPLPASSWPAGMQLLALRTTGGLQSRSLTLLASAVLLVSVAGAMARVRRRGA